MRAWLVLASGGLLYAVALGWAAASLPSDGVPMHFGSGGAADRLASRGDALTAMAVLGALLMGLAAALVLLARHGPLTLLNFPHKAYWLAPQRLPAVRRMLADDVALIMGGTLAFLAFVPIWTVLGAEAPDRTVAPVLFWVPLGCFGLALLGWAVCVARRRYCPDQGPNQAGRARRSLAGPGRTLR